MMKLAEWMEQCQLNDADLVYVTRTIDPEAQGVSLRSVQTARYGHGAKTMRIAMLLHEASGRKVPLESFVDGAWLDDLRRRAAEFEPS
jgi:hypothetical protein